MGYPMTYKRVVNRNDLRSGYDARASTWNPDRLPDGFRQEFDRMNRMWGNLQGDLRRLERDTVDENATCRYIADKLGVSSDLVAGVLKEFMDW